MQIMEGNIIDSIKKCSDTIGYFHIADVPGRFQPGTGELNYKNILTALAETGYEGNVGFEFEPKGMSSEEAVKCVFDLIK
jgi:hydroxypyruvate isomerase